MQESCISESELTFYLTSPDAQTDVVQYALPRLSEQHYICGLVFQTRVDQHCRMDMK